MSSIFTATDADGYEQMMGRWSRLLCRDFIEFSDVRPGHSILDVGCGTGALEDVALSCIGQGTITGVDIAPNFIRHAQERVRDPRVTFVIGDASQMNLPEAQFDRTLSSLVLSFVPEYKAAIAEMMRVTKPGGLVAAAVWDAPGGLTILRMFWDTAAMLDEEAGKRRGRSYSNQLMQPGALASLFVDTGLRDIVERDCHFRMNFQNFQDYWSPFTTGQGPPGEYTMALSASKRENLRAALFDAYCAGSSDGARSFVATARMVRGLKS